jgi:hypothetical protein
MKIFTLYILRRLAQPVDFDTLFLISQCDNGVTYFDFLESLNDLTRTEHVTLDAGLYSITDKGARNGEITESGLPYSLRLKADRELNDVRSKLRRKSLVRTERRLRRKGGYTVRLTLSDGLAEIISLDLYAMDDEQAQQLEDGFNARAEGIYNKIIDLILDE